MVRGLAWRVVILASVLLAPSALAAAPTPYPGGAQATEDQEITDLALDPTGRYVIVAVRADLVVNPLQTPRNHVYKCDLGQPVTGAAQPTKSCNAARHTETWSGTGASQAVSAISFQTGTGLSARFGVAGPGDVVGYWTNAAQGALWEEKLDDGYQALNVTVTPEGRRVIVAAEPPPTATGASRLVAYDALASAGTGLSQWEYSLSSSSGETSGVKPAAMEHARNGRYLAVGLTGSQSDPSSGTLLVLDAAGSVPTSSSVQKHKLSGAVTQVRVSDDGGALVVGTTAGMYFFPYVNNKLAALPFSNLDPDGARHVALSRDGQRFAAAFGNEIAFYRHINDTRVAEELGRFDAKAAVNGLAYDATGQVLVAIAGNRVYGFAPARPDPVWDFDATRADAGGLDGPLREVAVSEAGDRLVVAGRTKFNAYATRTLADLSIVGPALLDASPATTVRVQLQVKSTGSLADEFSFRVTAPVGWRTPLTPEPVALVPDQVAFVNVSVEVPEGKQPGKYPVDIEVLSSSLRNASRDAKVDSARFEVVVPRAVSLVLEPDEERFEVRKGETRSVAVEVKNVGNAKGIVNLSVDQAPTRGGSWTIVMSTTRAEIDAGGSLLVQLDIAVPSDAVSGEVNPITLVAVDGDHRATRTLTALVEPDFSVEVVPSNRSLEFVGTAPQTISVTIKNLGNTDDTYNLTAIVGAGALNDWRVTVHQPQVSVPRGESRQVGVSITPASSTPRPSTVTIEALSQRSLEGHKNSASIAVASRPFTPTPTPASDESLIPGPALPLLALALVGAALAARRARGGR